MTDENFLLNVFVVLPSLLFAGPTIPACPDGFEQFHLKCFLIGPDMDFDEADPYCEVNGGHLVEVHDFLDASTVRNYVQTNAKPAFLGPVNLKDNRWFWLQTGLDATDGLQFLRATLNKNSPPGALWVSTSGEVLTCDNADTCFKRPLCTIGNVKPESVHIPPRRVNNPVALGQLGSSNSVNCLSNSFYPDVYRKLGYCWQPFFPQQTTYFTAEETCGGIHGRLPAVNSADKADRLAVIIEEHFGKEPMKLWLSKISITPLDYVWKNTNQSVLFDAAVDNEDTFLVKSVYQECVVFDSQLRKWKTERCTKQDVYFLCEEKGHTYPDQVKANACYCEHRNFNFRCLDGSFTEFCSDGSTNCCFGLPRDYYINPLQKYQEVYSDGPRSVHMAP